MFRGVWDANLSTRRPVGDAVGFPRSCRSKNALSRRGRVVRSAGRKGERGGVGNRNGFPVTPEPLSHLCARAMMTAPSPTWWEGSRGCRSDRHSLPISLFQRAETTRPFDALAPTLKQVYRTTFVPPRPRVDDRVDPRAVEGGRVVVHLPSTILAVSLLQRAETTRPFDALSHTLE
jgi:hypothetical protein